MTGVQTCALPICLGKRHTIILSSHILPEVQATCDRVIVINNGKIVADDTAENLSKNLSDDHRFTVRVEGPESEIYRLLSSIPSMKEVSTIGEREPGAYDFIVESKPGEDIRREMFKRLASRNFPILSLRSSEMTLEDIFLQLTDTTEMCIRDRTKRGRMLEASYEAIRFQKLDLFTIALKQIGAYIAKSQFSDAVNVLLNGDGNSNPVSYTHLDVYKRQSSCC